MASRVCLVHYHEIGLKGKNRARFERILMDNLKAALAAFSVAAVNRISGHILVSFSVPGQAEAACDVIARVQYLVAHHHTYTNIDGADYRILVEADFLVNADEGACARPAIEAARERVFRTPSAIRLLDTIYLA